MNTTAAQLDEARHHVDDQAVRIRQLEQEVSESKASNAALNASLNHLTDTVKELNQTVAALRDVMNQGRGALWLAMVIAGSIGATMTLIIKHILIGPVK